MVEEVEGPAENGAEEEGEEALGDEEEVDGMTGIEETIFETGRATLRSAYKMQGGVHEADRDTEMATMTERKVAMTGMPMKILEGDVAPRRATMTIAGKTDTMATSVKSRGASMEALAQ